MKIRFFLRWSCIAVLCVIIASANIAAQNDDLPKFRITVENKYSETVRVSRVWDDAEKLVTKDLDPGELIDTDVDYQSDQVFIVWDKHEVMDKPILFSPLKNERLVLTVNANRTITTQVAARRR